MLSIVFILFKTGLEIAGNYSEVIYFRRMGVTNLPQLYTVEPLAMVLVLILFGLLINRTNLIRLLNILNLAFAILLVVANILILAKWQHVYFSFYIVQRIFLALLPLTFWLVCSDLFDIRQARRLFVLITASGLAGALLGDLLTGILSGRLPTEMVITVTSVFFLAALGVGSALARMGLKKSQAKTRVTTRESFSPVLPFHLLGQPFIRLFAVLILVTGMLEPVWRYQLNDIANQSFSAESSLIAFIGYFKGAAVLVVVLFQLFFAGKVVEKIGIPWSISMHPVGLAGIMLLLAFYPTLMVAIACVAIIGIIRIGFDESGRKAVVGIYPQYERTRVSSLERQLSYLGIFMGGVFLIWAVGHLTMQQINWIAAGLAAAWLFFFAGFRREYARACLSRGRSPLDELIKTLEPGKTQEKTEDGAVLQSGLNSVWNTNPYFVVQYAGLDGSQPVHELILTIGRNEQIFEPALQAALRGPVLRVRNSAARAIYSQAGGVEKHLTAQLDYAEKIWPWRGIPIFQKLVREQVSAAGRACLLLLENNYPDGEIHTALRMLQSPEPDLRANGIEALDITLRDDQKRRLINLFEDVLLAGSTDQASLAAQMLEPECQKISQSGDPELTFWSQVWQLRSGGKEYDAPVPRQQPFPDELKLLMAAVNFPQTGDEAMQMADKIDSLRASETFSSLSEAELRVLALCTREAEYELDEVIFEEGQPGRAMYIILEGEVELATLADKKSLQALVSGDVFGERALFTEEQYALTAITLSRSRLLILEKEIFLELIQYYPNISLSLLRSLASRYEKAIALLQKVWI